jgi:flavin-dependent dehydrogenase
MINENVSKTAVYDVVICGGGLAGLTLARQLRLGSPTVKILVLEKNKFPLPEAACKVGESSVEIAGFYFREILQLRDYLKNEQLVKCGLRYFFKNGTEDFASYPEIGLSRYSALDSYQLDRGKFENDLYAINKVNGVDITEGVSVTDIRLNKDSHHEIVYQDSDKNEMIVNCLWVVDATGRRSFLQKKLSLRAPVDSSCSAVWFRVKGRFDVSDFVPPANREWHQRVPDKIRYYSTTHLMGPGYWIWLIPLTNNNTSVGVVIDENKQSYAELNTLVKAKAWIRKEYPIVADRVESFEVLDFLSLRHYSYSSKQIYSKDRWACTGEAALFPDPFYSPGSNLIGTSNSIITKLVIDDLATGQVPEDRVDFYNQFVISQNEWFIYDIQSSYPYFGIPQVESLSYIWDIIVGWTMSAPQLFNLIFLDELKLMGVRDTIRSFSTLSLKVRQLFIDWSAVSRGTFHFSFIDYLGIPFVKKLYDRVLKRDKPVEELVSDYKYAMNYIEEFVQVLFYMILEDCMPERLKDMPDPYWINVWAVSLKPERWSRDGLFKPRTECRDLSEVENQIRGLYTFETINEIKQIDKRIGEPAA